ncbi:adenosine deaminase family protein [Spirulina subsalsa]|uniref:adenosine deaminase family protein n=1 Tax=Spirulina subsalsa TaxID=54311 RepID=UPI0002E47F4A|nr:hypothetical protein [Spirulina subsalsa]
MLKPHHLLVFLTVLLTTGLTPRPALTQRTLTPETPSPTLVQETPQTPRERDIANWFEANRDRHTQIRAFVQRMPKGADLHSHLSGAVYAESYLGWAASENYCVDPNALVLVAPADCRSTNGHIQADQVFRNIPLYNALIDRWSVRNLPFAGQTGHNQFFSAFDGFDAFSSDTAMRPRMVAEVIRRAAAQNIQYLELMLTIQGRAIRDLAPELQLSRGDEQAFALARRQLLQNPQFQALIQQGVAELDTLQQDLFLTLGCHHSNRPSHCNVTVNYIQQTNRLNPPEQVFAQFVYAVELIKAHPDIVGLNLVAPEDHPVALRDYSLQMAMLGFLHRQEPDLNIALHAGELTLGLVPPSELRFHIREAVEVAQAKRIGHGVSIFYENDPWDLLATMAQRGVLVEICLTSNDVILNVTGPAHPFLDYLKAGVPVTLATDDEGIGRIDLSHEYWQAAIHYGLGYVELKRLARNSLEYSFLPGDSLWSSPEYRSLVAPCQGDNPGSGTISSGCANFLANHERANQQWLLEAQFSQFEAAPWP